MLRDVVDWVCGFVKDAPVKKGDQVQPSTRIGRIGASGGTSWAHLHHEQRY
ncbi:hypothetical protein AB0K68_32740 [Streptomyces sp. NPDC050698]